MIRQEIDAELGMAGAQELLASTSAAHLAYVGKDGTPRVIPVGYCWTGEEFVIATAPASPKVAALLKSAEVAMSIDSGDTPETARALSIRGRASVSVIDGVVPEYLAAARKTMDEDEARKFEHEVRQTYDRMVRIAITPTWVRFYDFGAGRMPRFLKDLVESKRS